MATIYDLQSFHPTTTLADLGTVTESATITASGWWGNGNALDIPNNNDYVVFGGVLGNRSTVACGFRMYYSSLAWSFSPLVQTTFWSFLDGGTRCVEVRQEMTGEMTVAVSGVAEYATGYMMPIGIWVYVELKAVIHNTTGTLELRINGGTVWSISGVDTQVTANAYVNGYVVGNCYGSGLTGRGQMVIHDIYVADDFLGDIRVQARLPNGTGNSSGLVGSDGDQLSNYALVDETPRNDDTDYVYGSIVGEQDTYAVADVPVAGAVRGLKVKMRARKTAAGTRSIAAVTRSDGVDYAGTTQALTTSYAYYDEVQSVDPDTSAEWTDTAFDAAEFGAKVAA